MTTSMRPDRRLYERPISEKDYFLKDRFSPGEFVVVLLLGLASLILWSVAIFGLVTEPAQTTTGQSQEVPAPMAPESSTPDATSPIPAPIVPAPDSTTTPNPAPTTPTEPSERGY